MKEIILKLLHVVSSHSRGTAEREKETRVRGENEGESEMKYRTYFRYFCFVYQDFVYVSIDFLEHAWGILSNLR